MAEGKIHGHFGHRSSVFRRLKQGINDYLPLPSRQAGIIADNHIVLN